MNTIGVIELDCSFTINLLISIGSSNCQNVAVWVPLDTFDVHACIYKDWSVVSFLAHQLHASTLVGDAKLCSILIQVLIEEALLVSIIPLHAGKRHLFPL